LRGPGRTGIGSEHQLGGLTMGVTLLFDPSLVEEAVNRVLGAADDPSPLLAYDRDRSNLDDEALSATSRESALRELHQTWFRRLGLDTVIADRLKECRFPVTTPASIRIIESPGRKGDGVDLFHPPGLSTNPELPCVVIRVRPESYLDPVAMRSFLRRELSCVDDMLNPEFGYDADEFRGDEPPHRELAQDRYTLLWGISVAARLRDRFQEEDPLPDALAVRLLSRTYPRTCEQGGMHLLEHVRQGPIRHAELALLSRDDLAGERFLTPASFGASR
jgi:hypothetical protein